MAGPSTTAVRVVLTSGQRRRPAADRLVDPILEHGSGKAKAHVTTLRVKLANKTTPGIGRPVLMVDGPVDS